MRHEQTIIYDKSIALMQTAREAIESFPPGFGFLAEQLRRNTSSVGHNYAEGYYPRSNKQQRRFLGYAIQSAREASMSFDTALCFRAASAQARFARQRTGSRAREEALEGLAMSRRGLRGQRQERSRQELSNQELSEQPERRATSRPSGDNGRGYRRPK